MDAVRYYTGLVYPHSNEHTGTGLFGGCFLFKKWPNPTICTIAQAMPKSWSLSCAIHGLPQCE